MNPDPPEVCEVRNLFQKRVPQIASGVVTIRGIVRQPGNRTILAVASSDPATDAVGSCVGMRGATVKGIIAELHGESIDIVLWNDDAQKFLSNLFAPMQFANVTFDAASGYAKAVIKADSDLASSKTVALRSQLFSQLTGWHLQFEIEG
jgi:N utilization substance protein A